MVRKIQPLLANGDDIGADLMVITNGQELNKFIALGYLAPLKRDQLTNFAEFADEFYTMSASTTATVHRSLRLGDHRHRLRPRTGRTRDHLHQGPVGPRVQGHGSA